MMKRRVEPCLEIETNMLDAKVEPLRCPTKYNHIIMENNVEATTGNIVKAPVFIVGEARSGSSILNRTLEILPSFRPRKVWHIESKIMAYANRAFALEDYQNTGPFKYLLLDDKVFRQFLDSIRPVQRLHRAIHAVSPRLATLCNRSTTLWSLTGNKRMLRSFFLCSLKARGSKRVIEKTPDHSIHSEKLLNAFPDCKVLYIYRHPIDVFSSYKKLAGKLGEESWSNITVDDFCQLYHARADYMLRFRDRHPSSCMLLRYEDFVDNPKEQLEMICDFIGEPFDESCLDPTKSDRGNDKDYPIKGAIESKTKVWSEHLDMGSASELESKLAPIMARLGYSRYTR